mmetsp:Transcript_5145/g.17038  ORF Transcript_5145/g.17038 Transcript_5145/m.17038 type:complete len:293 (+) Transcript_5145:5083-5961(+)
MGRESKAQHERGVRLGRGFASAPSPPEETRGPRRRFVCGQIGNHLHRQFVKQFLGRPVGLFLGDPAELVGHRRGGIGGGSRSGIQQVVPEGGLEPGAYDGEDGAGWERDRIHLAPGRQQEHPLRADAQHPRRRLARPAARLVHAGDGQQRLARLSARGQKHLGVGIRYAGCQVAGRRVRSKRLAPRGREMQEQRSQVRRHRIGLLARRPIGGLGQCWRPWGRASRPLVVVAWLQIAWPVWRERRRNRRRLGRLRRGVRLGAAHTRRAGAGTLGAARSLEAMRLGASGRGAFV